jgi:hypothetical protein
LSLVGAVLLVFVLLVRPQEFIPALQPLRLLNAVTGLVALGIAIEFIVGRGAQGYSPQFPWLLAFVGWCMLVTVRRLGLDGIEAAWESVGLSAIFMVVVASAGGTLERWRVLTATMVVIAVAIAVTCIHQGRQEPECIVIDTSSYEGERSGEGEPDGRSCDTAYICEQQGLPRAAYACEKVGLFGTFTEGMRVRWRGTLGDPNELALLLGAVMPFAFAWASASRSRWIVPAVGAVVGLILWCVALTGSRGGQLVVLTVLGVYFVRRYGLKGALIGAMLALPVLLFGGRSGEEAESSSLERIDLLYEGMDMIRAYPVLGVGVGQFVDHAFGGMTAHNSYVLAAAELGLPGSLLWTILLYVSVKIPWILAFRTPPGVDERFRPYAVALVVAFAGMAVGIFFLSFCYKAVLFVFLGLSGALFVAAKRNFPDLHLGVSWREAGGIVLADVAILVFVLIYSRIMGARA